MTMTQQLSKPQPVKQIAQRVVNECLRVQPDEQVTIFSWDHTLDYTNTIALEIEQAGGVSTTILQMNDLYWRLL
jgi:leucyl aminopeptidase (aminopeptidase T)